MSNWKSQAARYAAGENAAPTFAMLYIGEQLERIADALDNQPVQCPRCKALFPPDPKHPGYPYRPEPSDADDLTASLMSGVEDAHGVDHGEDATDA